MNYSMLRDRSEYFRGLLLVMAADGHLDERQKQLIEETGKRLGFEERYIRESIHNVLSNPFLNRQPPEFSNQDILHAFLMDSTRVAVADGQLHPREHDWLKAVAMRNGMREEVYEHLVQETCAECFQNPQTTLSLYPF